MISQDKITAELKRKKELQQARVDALNAQIDALEKEFIEKESELNTLDSNLHVIMGKLGAVKSDIGTAQREYQLTAKALDDSIKSAEAHNEHLVGLVDSIDYSRELATSQVTSLVDEMKSSLYSQVALIQSTVNKVASDMHRSATIDCKTALQNVIKYNPNSLMVVIDANGKPFLIDNRETNAIIENDAAANVKTGGLTPFRFFKQLSPLRGVHKNEVYSIPGLMTIISKYSRWNEQIPNGILVEQKYNGVKVQIHKVGDKVVCWTSKRVDVSQNIPSIIMSLLNVKHDFIAEGTIELYTGGKNTGTSGAQGALFSPNPGEAEENLKLSMYDVLWWDEDDIHTKNYADRTGYLQHFKGIGKNVAVSEQTLAKSNEEIVNAVMDMSKRHGSDGAVIKHPAYKYSLDGKTSMMISFKNEKSLNMVVLAADRDEESGKYAYECGVKDDTGIDIYMGKTLRTDIIAIPGDILKVVFASIIPFWDRTAGRHHFKVVHARPVEIRDGVAPSTLRDILDITEEFKYSIQDKPCPEIAFTKVDIKGDCACTNKPLPPPVDDNELDIEFKLLEQTTTMGDKAKSSYHLIFKMPTKYLDFVSSRNPLNNDSFIAENKTSLSERWSTTGTISRDHKLNDDKAGVSRIDVLDKGFAKLKLNQDAVYKMDIALFGEYMTGTLFATRTASSNDMWDIKIAPGGV